MNTTKLTAAVLSIMLTSACATDIHRSETEADPYEDVNRKIFAFNDGFYENIVFPIERGYRKITTPTIRQRISSFVSNMDEPISTFNYMLQLEPKAVLISISRFAINSTLGLAGLFDVAAGWGLVQDQTSLGETMASWCIADGPYLVVPFIGPSTPRNFVGSMADFVADPVYWMTYNDANYRAKISYPYTVVKYVSKFEGYMDLYNSLTKDAVDPYVAIRSAYLQNQRQVKCRFAAEDETPLYDFDFDAEMEE